MRRYLTLLTAVLGVALVVAASAAAPARGTPPEHYMTTVGGSFENPCTFSTFAWEAEGQGLIGSTSQLFVGHGSGVDLTTGREYAVTFQSTLAMAPDESGLTIHGWIIAQAGPDTFIRGGVSILNARPEGGVEVNIVNLICAGEGRVGL